MTQRIGALLFPGFELLDLFGPMEMFGLLPDAYEITLIADHRGAIPSSHGLSAHATRTLDQGFNDEILFVPGGPGVQQQLDNESMIKWLQLAAEQADYTLSVCTGSGLLAKAGILDGRSATTNKAGFHRITPLGPKVTWVSEARWVEDGPFFTSSGVSAGMDMTLAFIAKIHGTEAAEKIALTCEYTWHRDEKHDPFAKAYGLH